jgi:hypothetical protein
MEKPMLYHPLNSSLQKAPKIQKFAPPFFFFAYKSRQIPEICYKQQSNSKISSYKKDPRNTAIKLGIIQMNKGLQVSYCDAGSWVAIRRRREKKKKKRVSTKIYNYAT